MRPRFAWVNLPILRTTDPYQRYPSKLQLKAAFIHLSVNSRILPMKENRRNYNGVKAEEAIRAVGRATSQAAAVFSIGISEGMRDEISSCVFQCQRELIRLGILTKEELESRLATPAPIRTQRRHPYRERKKTGHALDIPPVPIVR